MAFRSFLHYHSTTVLFLSTFTGTTSFFCLQSQAQRALGSISLPHFNWNSVKPFADMTSPYANFILEQWIVVSVLSYLSDALQKMVKIKGWQVLAIGNSRTPGYWSLKGAIFLSLYICKLV
ncbi:hypothetical protein V6N12_018861 [Hibiscus sabdariffa]|uniref:Uncharacterized protein n=1 Tax=Hibiscus sabdariffa TaxID=183260 RepID=A0ABR2ASW1_9ROSI